MKKRGIFTHAERIGLLFASPWLIGFGIFGLFPIVASAFFSFCRYNIVRPPRFIGLENYHLLLFEDPLFWKSLYNTLFFTAFSVPLSLVFSLSLAMLLNQKLRGIAVFRTIFYMPSVIGGVATIMMWLWVFNPDYGLLNSFLRWVLGLFGARAVELPKWLLDEKWAKPALILMSLWGAGGAMLIFLAALQNVPESLYEAADIDGAGRWRKFLNITVPQISPTIFFNLVMGVIGSFQVFAQAFLMTAGGPNKATLFYVLYLYQKAFQDLQFGYASALAWILFAIIMVFTLLILRSSKLWVYYESE